MTNNNSIEIGNFRTRLEYDNVEDIAIVARTYFESKGLRKREIKISVEHTLRIAKEYKGGVITTIVYDRNKIISVCLSIKHPTLQIRLLNLLFTKKSYRGIGLGSGLILFIKGISEENENNVFGVEVDPDEYYQVLPFYKRFGLNKSIEGLLESNLLVVAESDIDTIMNEAEKSEYYEKAA